MRQIMLFTVFAFFLHSLLLNINKMEKMRMVNKLNKNKLQE